jgi:hypothetical protein
MKTETNNKEQHQMTVQPYETKTEALQRIQQRIDKTMTELSKRYFKSVPMADT